MITNFRPFHHLISLRRDRLVNILLYLSLIYLLLDYYRDGDLDSDEQLNSTEANISISLENVVSPLNPLIQELPPWLSLEFIQDYLQDAIITNTSAETAGNACQLPNLQPFNPEIMHMLNRDLSSKSLNCENERYPFIFNSVVKPSPKLFTIKGRHHLYGEIGVTSCCMRKIIGYKEGLAYGEVEYGKDCLPVSLEVDTDVPLTWEFLVIECEFRPTSHVKEFYVATSKIRRKVDLHAFIRRDNTRRRVKASPSTPNVLILGIDSTSRLNFHRVFPEVHTLLVKSMKAVEFRGYHKIGESRFSNFAAMLTNKQLIYNGTKSDENGLLGCENGPNLTFDRCPFIWHNFRAEGYKTFYAEDGVGMDTFYGSRGGFKKPPTDYFLRPLQSAGIPALVHEGPSNSSSYCYGPRSAFRTMLDYLEKMAIVLEKQQSPYFAFAYSSSYTQDALNGGRYIAKELLETLEFLYWEGYLTNTVLFLVSDHGIRMGEVRNHYQMFQEDKLPFMYAVFPDGFREKFNKQYENLKRNARSRLVTPFDVYETLVDLLPGSKFGSLAPRPCGKPGCSLFTLIPESRTCETAGIRTELCACSSNLRSVVPTKNDTLMKEAAKIAVSQINDFVRKSSDLIKCANLTLNLVLKSSQVETNSTINSTKAYRILFETIPGKAVYEIMYSLTDRNEGALSYYDSFF